MCNGRSHRCNKWWKENAQKHPCLNKIMCIFSLKLKIKTKATGINNFYALRFVAIYVLIWNWGKTPKNIVEILLFVGLSGKVTYKSFNNYLCQQNFIQSWIRQITLFLPVP